MSTRLDKAFALSVLLHAALVYFALIGLLAVFRYVFAPDQPAKFPASAPAAARPDQSPPTSALAGDNLVLYGGALSRPASSHPTQSQQTPFQRTPECDAAIKSMNSLRTYRYHYFSEAGQDFWYYRNIAAHLPYRGVYIDFVHEHFTDNTSHTYFLDRCLGWTGVCAQVRPAARSAVQALRGCEIAPSSPAALSAALHQAKINNVDFVNVGPHTEALKQLDFASLNVDMALVGRDAASDDLVAFMAAKGYYKISTVVDGVLFVRNGYLIPLTADSLMLRRSSDLNNIRGSCIAFKKEAYPHYHTCKRI